MKSISGSSPCRCSALIRSAAKMKLPLSTATMMRSLSLAAAISRASSSTRSDIRSALNSGLMSVAAAVSAMVLVGLGETHLDAADIARRRRNLSEERRVPAGGKLLLADLSGPFRDFLAALVTKRDHDRGHVDRGGAGIYDVPLHFEHGLAAFIGPAVTDAFEGQSRSLTAAPAEQRVEARGARKHRCHRRGR